MKKYCKKKKYNQHNTEEKKKMSIAYKNLFITPILLCIVTFFILKLNGNIDWKWAYIFIPLWVIFGLIFIWTAILFTKYQYKVLDLNSVDYHTMVNWRWYADYNVQLGIVIYDCLLCFSIFICLQLDHNINWDWFYIFVPLWVISLTWFYWWNESRKHFRYNNHRTNSLKKNITIATTTTMPIVTPMPLHQQVYNEIHYFSDNNDIDDGDDNDDNVNSPLYIKSGTFSLNFNLKTYQFVISIGIIVFNIFLPLQLDKKTVEDRWSWWIIFLPLWVSLLVWFWSLCSYTFIKTSKSIHIAAVYASQNVPLWIELIIFYITWFIITIFTIVLSIELDHHHGESKDKIDPLTIFSPVIILLCINWWLCFAYIFYYKRELSYYNNNGGGGGGNQSTSAATIGILNKDLMNIKINFNSS